MKTSKIILGFCGMVLLSMVVQHAEARRGGRGRGGDGSGFFLRAGAGFDLGMAGNTMKGFANTKEDTSGAISTEQISFSLGQGMVFGGGLGYMFTPNIGAGLDVTYLLGSAHIATDDNMLTSTKTETSISSSMLRFTPSLVVASGLFLFNPYLKVGLIIGTGGKVVKKITKEVSLGGVLIPFPDEQSIEYTGGTPVGVASTLGAAIDLSPNFAIMLDLNMISMNYAATRSEVTKNTSLGIDNLPNMLTIQRETEYVDKLDFQPTTVPDSNMPAQALREYTSFCSIGVGLGVKITF